MRILLGIVLLVEGIVGFIRGVMRRLYLMESKSEICVRVLDMGVKDGGRGFVVGEGYLERFEENKRLGKLNWFGRFLYILRRW